MHWGCVKSMERSPMVYLSRRVSQNTVRIGGSQAFLVDSTDITRAIGVATVV